MRAQFNLQGFFTALDGERKSRSLTWKQVADEAGVGPSSLSRLSKGHRPDVDTLAALVAWGRLDANAFMTSNSMSQPATTSAIAAYLHRDPRLSAEAASALTDILAISYSRLADSNQSENR